MTNGRKNPSEWLEPVPAEVFACLIPGEMRIMLLPRVGFASRGAPRVVLMDIIPFDLRVPNMPLWVQLDDTLRIVRVWRREK
jgi:hypothetical protein